MQDARFEDGAPERPVRLRAETEEDLLVISALVQDAVAQTSDMSWMRRKRRFALLLNRFRWEDVADGPGRTRPFERVQSMLVISSALSVKGQSIDPSDPDLALSLLSLSFESGADGAGDLVLTFAGDGAISVAAECLDVSLQDVSRPYEARAQKIPSHPETD